MEVEEKMEKLRRKYEKVKEKYKNLHENGGSISDSD